MSKKECTRCRGKGHNERVVVIGTIVTIMKDRCYSCNGTGKSK